jgi:hypothetical protein
VLSAIRSIGPTRTGILLLLEPVIAVVLAAVLLGQQVVRSSWSAGSSSRGRVLVQLHPGGGAPMLTADEPPGAVWRPGGRAAGGRARGAARRHGRHGTAGRRWTAAELTLRRAGRSSCRIGTVARAPSSVASSSSGWGSYSSATSSVNGASSAVLPHRAGRSSRPLVDDQRAGQKTGASSAERSNLPRRVFLFENYYDLDWQKIWPFFLIIPGVGLLVGALRGRPRRRDLRSGSQAPAAGRTDLGPVPDPAGPGPTLPAPSGLTPARLHRAQAAGGRRPCAERPRHARQPPTVAPGTPERGRTLAGLPRWSERPIAGRPTPPGLMRVRSGLPGNRPGHRFLPATKAQP